MTNQMKELIEKVERWAEVRKLHTAEPKAQALKVIEEFMETLISHDRGDIDGVIDGIGDTYVTLIILLQQLGKKEGNMIDFAFYIATEKALEIGLFDGTEQKMGATKAFEAIGRLSSGISKGNHYVFVGMQDIISYVGHLANKLNTTLEHCLQVAYNEIKDRKGMMIDGTFVKYDDLSLEQQKELDE